MIRFDAVNKRFSDAGTPAVDDVSFELPAGEVTALIGPSGSGKSTTLRMVNRLIEPDSGTVLVDGVDVRSRPLEELRRGMGYAIQGVGLFPHWTVQENIGCVPWLNGWDKARIAARVEELLELVGLPAEEYASKRPSQLSGGEAQRVGVARALAADPPILLMDEPFGAVDPLTRERLQSEFLGIQRKLRKTVLFVTHDLDEAIRLADRIAIMRDGRLLQYDCVERVIAYPADEFVRGFVGSERSLKRLGLASVTEAMGPARRALESGAVAHVGESATLREALAKILETGIGVVGVVREGDAHSAGAGAGETDGADRRGDVIGSVSIEDIVARFGRPVE